MLFLKEAADVYPAILQRLDLVIDRSQLSLVPQLGNANFIRQRKSANEKSMEVVPSLTDFQQWKTKLDGNEENQLWQNIFASIDELQLSIGLESEWFVEACLKYVATSIRFPEMSAPSRIAFWANYSVRSPARFDGETHIFIGRVGSKAHRFSEKVAQSEEEVMRRLSARSKRMFQFTFDGFDLLDKDVNLEQGIKSVHELFRLSVNRYLDRMAQDLSAGYQSRFEEGVSRTGANPESQVPEQTVYVEHPHYRSVNGLRALALHKLCKMSLSEVAARLSLETKSEVGLSRSNLHKVIHKAQVDIQFNFNT
jgi:hypothetical protein